MQVLLPKLRNVYSFMIDRASCMRLTLCKQVSEQHGRSMTCSCARKDVKEAVGRVLCACKNLPKIFHRGHCRDGILTRLNLKTESYVEPANCSKPIDYSAN